MAWRKLWPHFNRTDARARDWIARCALLPPEAAVAIDAGFHIMA